MRPRRPKAELEERRKRAVRLLKTHGVREVAREVGVTPGSVERWTKLDESGGMAAMRARPDRGSLPELSEAGQGRLSELLLKGSRAEGYGTELWTLERVARTIEHHFGAYYSLPGVWLLLGRMGWSYQKPERQARERNDAEVERWRRVTWPRLGRRGRT